MKLLIIGDLHGRDCWKTIINDNPDVDKIIFLGDYVDSFYISPDDQIKNFNELLDYKEQNLDKMILLRGNHDISELGYSWAKCSGFNIDVYEQMPKERFLNLTQWIYIHDNIIFSHAGITSVWLENTNLTLEQINNESPSDIFGFWPNNMLDVYGTSETQGPLWIRPQTLVKYNISGYDQVIGHTNAKTITNAKQSAKEKRNIWLCDTLDVREYLIIEDGNVKVCKFN